MDGNIKASISSEAIKSAEQAVSVIKEALPFLISLSGKEIMTLPKMDDGRRPFVEKALSHGKNEKGIVPPYVDLEELQADLKLYKDLNDIYQPIKQLEKMLSDTLIAAGSDSYTAALSIYNSVKRAAKDGVPGTQAIVDDLKKLFN